jgi:adenosylcobinamide-GDP ribazoletransferase
MHEDGLADFFDAFAGGWWSKERILEIMKDSRIGSFGSLALIMVLLLKYQSLVALDSRLIPPALIAAHAFSRFAAGSFILTQPYVRQAKESHFKPVMLEKMRVRDFVVSGLFGVLPIFLFGKFEYWLLVPLLWLVRLLFGRWFTRKIGGYTGDCAGATQQIVEASFYLGVLAITRSFGL